jgi:hypothetical protein
MQTYSRTVRTRGLESLYHDVVNPSASTYTEPAGVIPRSVLGALG